MVEAQIVPLSETSVRNGAAKLDLEANGTESSRRVIDDMPIPGRRKTDSRAAMSAETVRTGLYRHVDDRPVADIAASLCSAASGHAAEPDDHPQEGQA